MSKDRPHACEVTREELLAVRCELEVVIQRLSYEIAGARTRIRELEAQVKGMRAASRLAATGAIVHGDNVEPGHCPQCDKLGRICYACERYVDGLAITDG